jgi:hypothetical protein
MIDKLKHEISNKLDIAENNLFNNNVTLSEILTISDKVTNSIDILEVIAGTIAENNLDDQLELPVFTLDSKIDDLIDQIRNQLTN